MSDNNADLNKKLKQTTEPVLARQDSSNPIEVKMQLRVQPIVQFKKLYPEKSSNKRNVRAFNNTSYSRLINEDESLNGVLQNCLTSGLVESSSGNNPVNAFIHAGPRETLFFEPSQSIGAIVTCGGICPGLNSIIREVTHSLLNLYGAKKVYGFQGGWGGIYERPVLDLTLDTVRGINNLGGTILLSARGGFDEDKIISKLVELNINQLYVVGGDGTFRGGNAICEGVKKRNLLISVICIPKTIDNDIAIIDRSFGFNTAVEEALRAVRAARVEAQSCVRGIGIVKVMGRSAGFIAENVALSSGDVDLVLIPEINVCVDGGATCVKKHIGKVLEKKGNAVVIVAEGAGENLLGRSEKVDAGGNRKLQEIGLFIKQELEQLPKVTVKYIDPSYMIRSVPANAADSLYCIMLSQNAVHAAMAGFSNCCVGLVNSRSCLIPIEEVTKLSPRVIDVKFSRSWEGLCSLTGQPM